MASVDSHLTLHYLGSGNAVEFVENNEHEIT